MSADDGISESVSGGVRWRSWSGRRVSKFISQQKETKYRKHLCREEEETRDCHMNSSRFAITARLRQSHRKPGASRVLDQLLLALALMYASSFLYLLRARPLYPRRHPLAGVHGPPQRR